RPKSPGRRSLRRAGKLPVPAVTAAEHPATAHDSTSVRKRIERRFERTSFMGWLAVVAVVLALVGIPLAAIGDVPVVGGWLHLSEHNTSDAGPGTPAASPSLATPPAGSVAPTSASHATPTPSTKQALGEPISIADTCGPPTGLGAPALPTAQICVIYWCRGDVLTLADEVDPSNIQVKIRPRILNNSTAPLDISISRPSRLRLLVQGSSIPTLWSPPPATKRAGDKPVLVTYDGQQYWGLPPNVPGDAVGTTDGQMFTGFATFWDGKALGPGQSYFKPVRYTGAGDAIREGDLVFQVPATNGQTVGPVVGLALLAPDGSVAAFQPQSLWPPSADPTSF
ncbi:MAG TPA: hypothetical protein VFG00_11870, partial [Acidothermaceae bacterium]|nr:hypothetical protein [Acidothermaceae bacterium]